MLTASDLGAGVGLEPLTCRLQEVRPRTPCPLAAQMTRIIALTALAALELSGDPVHEPVHARGSCVPAILLLCVVTPTCVASLKHRIRVREPATLS